MQYEGLNDINNRNNYDNIANDNRTIHDRMDECDSRMEESVNISDETRFNVTNINIQIYRYKFTDKFMNELYIFAKVHQYDHRKVFKEAWEVWLEENNTIVASEEKRIIELGYSGNIIEKMFKSARYYFRKKSTEKKSTSKKT
jgi:hypothetical protein